MWKTSFSNSILQQHAWNYIYTRKVGWTSSSNIAKIRSRTHRFSGIHFLKKNPWSPPAGDCSSATYRNGMAEQSSVFLAMECGTWESGYETKKPHFFGVLLMWLLLSHFKQSERTAVMSWRHLVGPNTSFLLGETSAFKSHVLEQITVETAGYCNILRLLKNDCELYMIYIKGW